MSVSCKNQKSLGFTLIELMIVVALVAIVATFAAPSFSNLIDNSRLASSSNNLVGVLNYARAESVKTGKRVIVSPTDGASWANGISAWIDGDGNGSMGAAEELRRSPPAKGTVTVSSVDSNGSNVGSILFTGGGFMRTSTSSSSDPRALTLSVCDARNGERGSKITVTIGGRIRAEDLTCG